jgi:hypothetical protein
VSATTWGTRVVSALKQLCIPQHHFCAHLGVNYTTLYRWRLTTPEPRVRKQVSQTLQTLAVRSCLERLYTEDGARYIAIVDMLHLLYRTACTTSDRACRRQLPHCTGYDGPHIVPLVRIPAYPTPVRGTLALPAPTCLDCPHWQRSIQIVSLPSCPLQDQVPYNDTALSVRA